jgi:RimJ/RimL family protein N-acetyltransferase
MTYDVGTMFETARLWLRRPRPADERELIALDSDPEVMQYVGSPPGPRPHADTVDRVRQRIGADHGSGGWWVIEGKGDGVLHGLGLLLPMPDGDDLEVGYRLARRSWGQGIATEACTALVDHALIRLSLPRVVAVIYPDNAASRRVLEKVGFVHDGMSEYRGARVERYALAREAWRGRG